MNSRSMSSLFSDEKDPSTIPKSDLAKLLVNHFQQSPHWAGTSLTISAIRQSFQLQHWQYQGLSNASIVGYNIANHQGKSWDFYLNNRQTQNILLLMVQLTYLVTILLKIRSQAMEHNLYTQEELPIDGLFSENYIEVLQRFQATRTPTKTIFYDNGANFTNGKII